MSNDRIIELEQQLEAIRAEIEKLKEEEKATSEIKLWRAASSDIYYNISGNGIVGANYEDGTSLANTRYNIGNYYRMRGLAEQDAGELALRGRLRQLRDELCYGFICGSVMYSICYDVKNECYIPFECIGTKIVGSIVFNTLTNAQIACDILNAELKNQ